MKRRKLVLLATLLALVVAFVASRPYWFFWKDGQWYVQPNSWRVKESQLSLRTGREKKFKTYTTTAELKTRMVLGLLNDDYLWDSFRECNLVPWEQISSLHEQEYTYPKPVDDWELLEMIRVPEDATAEYSWSVDHYVVHITGESLAGIVELSDYWDDFYYPTEGWQVVEEGLKTKKAGSPADPREEYLVKKDAGILYLSFAGILDKNESFDSVSFYYWNKQENAYFSGTFSVTNVKLQTAHALQWLQALVFE